ncbi:MAG: hypothetical protein ACREQR_17235 [Candidatus Binataceae bacterium]
MKKLFSLITMTVLASVTLAIWMASRNRFQQSAEYFPLAPKSNWTYRVTSKSQRLQFVVVDRVVGVKYIPALKLAGVVVDELYNMDRGGTRPVVYFAKDGYLTRVSGLDYDHENIQAPAWGRSEDASFLPAHLLPNASWTSEDLPFGHLTGGFTLAQIHHSFRDVVEVQVAAGDFGRCIRIDTRTEYRGGPYAKFHKKLTLVYTDWYAPDVGLVKTIAYEDGPGGAEVERVELIRFNIGPIPQQQ